MTSVYQMPVSVRLTLLALGPELISDLGHVVQ